MTGARDSQAFSSGGPAIWPTWYMAVLGSPVERRATPTLHSLVAYRSRGDGGTWQPQTQPCSPYDGSARFSSILKWLPWYMAVLGGPAERSPFEGPKGLYRML